MGHWAGGVGQCKWNCYSVVVHSLHGVQVHAHIYNLMIATGPSHNWLQLVATGFVWHVLTLQLETGDGGFLHNWKLWSGPNRLWSSPVSHTKHVWYSEHGTYYWFKFILEQAMSVTHIAVILHRRTGPAYEEESMKMDYPDARNEYGML